MYDATGVLLVDNRPSYDVELYPNEISDYESVVTTLSSILEIPKKKILRKTKRGSYIPYLPVTIAQDVGIDKVTVIEEQKPHLTGVNVHVRALRNYVYNDYAAHMLGYVGRITAKEYDTLKDQGYLPNDVIGKTGIEKTYDGQLGGKSGAMQIQVNNRGLKDKILSARKPIIGNDLYLTIDSRLQDVVETELAEKTGAIVVMNPKNGNILAYASKPSFDPNVFLRSNNRKDIGKLLTDKRRPLIDRVISGLYSPGSVFKIIVALTAIETKTINAGSRFYCPGYFMLGKARFNCWRKYGHGTLTLINALKYSCNVFFYKVGMQLGSTAISEGAKKFLLGQKTGIALPYEKKGMVPSPAWKKRVKKRSWMGGDTANFSIGQGFLLVTPIQVASFVSAIANGGIVYKPQIIHKIVRPKGKEITITPQVRTDIHADAKNLAIIKKGMYQVVNERDGSGHKAYVKDLAVCGKTGTVEYGSRDNEKNHAWFAGYAPEKQPEICVVVLVEAAKSGGVDAAPIAQKIFKRYYDISHTDKDHSNIIPKEDPNI